MAGLEKVTVAVGFHSRDDRLLAAALWMCRRTGAGLRLAHVCDSWTRSLLAPGLANASEAMIGAVQAETRRVASARLAAMRARVPAGIECETAVMDGEPVKALTGLGKSAGMIVVGAAAPLGAAAPAGMSTAVSLVCEADVPVMVLTDGAGMIGAAFDGPLTALVADDLEELSLGALAFGFDLAARAPGGLLVHAHVEPLTAGGTQRAGGLKDPGQLAEAVRTADEALRRRAGDQAARLETAQGAYRAEVATGAVTDELERTAVAYGAQIALYGRHRVYHRRTMHVGNVPFKAMLAQRRPVIIVPHA